ncbi:hypothetical protein B0J13DRAFT_515379 [Dactylonectria estremocensis]|uniref:Uncharacterized protein n=1 Tax=Dactylonectria estremocensis TaxID=1079267 RepID=A0A9P9IBB1_9HYPO|nr:hypothetical protein B0J13DRAFT_515379 [Dactylonectria estremocensis]
MAGSLPCPSWIWSNNSNVHAAKDRSWFGADYTPLDSTVGHLMGGIQTPVVGIGTVELPVKRSPRATGPRSHGILRLRNVLHVPTSICNVIGSPILDEYDINTGSSMQNTQGTIMDKQGRTVAYSDPHGKFFQVRLSGPPVGPRVGPTPFDPSAMYWINVRWADSEREKWEASCAGQALRPAEVGPLSTEEKQWLKKQWGGEFRFLASHGLNINKEEDREEGRIILRAILAGSDGDDSDDSDIGRDYPNDDRQEGQLADSYFDADELEFIKKHYGDSLTFMFSFGLKFYKTEDCEEAKSIVSSMVHPDNDDYASD